MKGTESGWYFGDPRLVGTSTNHIDIDVPWSTEGLMFDPDHASWIVRPGTMEIAGPDGTWVGAWVQLGPDPYVLVTGGTRAYAGLAFVATMPGYSSGHGGEFWGVIYKGPPPFGPLASPASG